MYKSILAGAIIALSMAGFSTVGFSQPRPSEHEKVCEAVFNKNKATIENMSISGDSAGIRSLLAKNGCPDAAVDIQKPPVIEKDKKPILGGLKGSCTITFNPFKITCSVTLGPAINLHPALGGGSTSPVGPGTSVHPALQVPNGAAK